MAKSRKTALENINSLVWGLVVLTVLGLLAGDNKAGQARTGQTQTANVNK